MSVKVLNWVFQHSEATDGARLVLLALADHAQDDGDGAYPSVATIAAKTRMSERGVQYALRRLEAGRHIEAAGKSAFQTVVYRITMGGASLAGVQDDARFVSQIAPKPSLEPSVVNTYPLREELKEEQQQLKGSGAKSDTDPEADRLCGLLADLILQDDPKAKVSPSSDRWQTAMRLLLKDRGGDVAEVERVMRWARHNDFWQPIILSPENLRRKFETLRGQSLRQTNDGLNDQGRMLRDLRIAREA